MNPGYEKILFRIPYQDPVVKNVLDPESECATLLATVQSTTEVTFTSPLPDPGEDGVSTVRLRHVVDQLHDEHGLAHAGTTKQT
jgi:hypothetical protein